jgi:arylsulfatase A-like enzyme
MVADDHRYDALGCMGNPVIQTPVLDGLAAAGTLFRNAFCTTSICCTSRASILTGQYARRHGIVGFAQDLTPEQMAQTYTAVLGRNGYRTAFVGKYGVGVHMPTEAFDHWAGFPGQGRYFGMYPDDPRHLTDILAERAVGFVDESLASGQPFCLSLSFKAPHSIDYDPRPWQPAPRFESLYRDTDIPVPATATPEAYEALPPFLKNSEGRKRWQNRFRTPARFQETMKDYYRLLTGIDEAAGRVVGALQRAGVADNTVIVYIGDNGFFLGERGLAGKWYAYEPSLRVPLIVYDPRLPRRLQGRAPAGMALNIDVAPTLLDLAGIPAPLAMQGRSLAPLMLGVDRPWRDDFFYEHLFQHPLIPRSEAVRTDRWKYIRWLDADPLFEELFDLEHDPLEQHDLTADRRYREVLKSMRTRWQTHRTELL